MQHINLVSQLDRVVEPPFSARQQAWLLGGVMLVLVLVYVIALWQQTGLNQALQQGRAQQAELAKQVEGLSAKKQAQENNSTLVNELAVLESAIRFRRQLLASIDPSDQYQQKGFSEHLSGLARQQLQGLWFTEIILGKQGGQMALMGYTLKPEYLPQYMQRLSQESVFSGQQFNVLRMAQAEKQRNALRFEIRAAAKDNKL
ncbi:PilN domain-containing protein [Dasania marina]|uniref:PilN domain-containing protein n=1 Tax=Dasania marina TaxID=471499 RepID=UPI0003707ED4|nr:PilN domain-containing protein [Dasania marina]